MRFNIIGLWILAAACICAQTVQTSGIDSKVANFQLQDASAKNQSLQLYAGKIVVLVFWSFKCPVSLAYNERMEALHNKYGDRGIIVFGVASGANETPAEIRANMSNLNISIPVLLDSDGGLAQQLGATQTPEVFILDRGGVLRYKGSLDNNKKVGDRGRIAYAEDAIESLLSGRPVAVSETRPFGCGIRYKTL